MVEASARGDIGLGGCLVGEDSPSVRCAACGNEFEADSE
jgi:hypothetical protein